MTQKKLSEKQIQKLARTDFRNAKKQYNHSPAEAAATVLRHLDHFATDLKYGLSVEELIVCTENGMGAITDIAQNLLHGNYTFSGARQEVRRRIDVYRQVFEKQGIVPLQLTHRGEAVAIYC